MDARRLVVFAMVVVINLHETICDNMNKNVNVPVRMLQEQRAHKAICQEVAREALFEFFNKGFNKRDLNNSLHFQENPDDCCLWRGVRCDALGSVVSLFISNVDATNANSSWPIPLGKLQSLKVLELDGFSFRSALPPTVGLLPQSLRNLTIVYSQVQDPVPWSALANLSSLRYLDLSRNTISSNCAGACNLTGLTHLTLSHSYPLQLQGPLPACLSLLPSLSYLDLSDNYLVGQIPPSWNASSSSLTFLDLSSNALEGPLPHALFLLLSHLDLSLNSLTSIGQLPPSWNSSSSSLTFLDLSSNALDGPLPHVLSLLPSHSLSHLDLSWNSFTSIGQVPSSWNSSFSSLTFLDLSKNALDGPLPHDVLGHNVEFLYVQSSCLRGSIPQGLANLTHLLELNMKDNEISGSISQIQWEKLQHLSSLELSDNQISGTISQIQWGKLQHLSILDLSHNQISGTISKIQWDMLLNLTSLDLSQNRLSGSLPASLGQLVHAVRLDLSDNNMTGSLPSWISTGPTSLQYLDLSFNKFTSFHTISHFNRSLHYLDLSHNLLNGSILPWLNSTDNLEGTLDLSDNLLYGSIPARFVPPAYTVNFSVNLLSGALNLSQLCTAAGFSFIAFNNDFSKLLGSTDVSACQLYDLDLHSNNLKGVLPWHALFGNGMTGSNLESLNLAENSLSGEFPERLPQPRIPSTLAFVLNLSQNCLSGAIPSYFNSWRLSYLDLSFNYFSGQIPSFCHSLDWPLRLEGLSLEGLRLANNLLNGSIPHGLGHCIFLQSLVLRNNLLTGFIPASIGHLSSSLVILDLANNHLRGSIPKWLQQMQSLRVLLLDYNNLTGLLPSSPWNTAELQVLGLSHNHLRGSIPTKSLSALLQGFCHDSASNAEDNSRLNEEIVIQAKNQNLSFTYILKVTVSLDLSHNNLQGPIPPELGSLNGLVFLSLSHNHLNGSIPESLANLTQLNSLDLSNNVLEGSIPNVLCSLTFLGFANVSNNQLKGLIPQCNQWSTFTSSSFQGNRELCGSQINVPCPNENVSPSPVLQQQTHEVDSEDNDFLLAVIVGVCISFPVCLLLTFYWAPIRQPTIIVSQRILTKLKRL